MNYFEEKGTIYVRWTILFTHQPSFFLIIPLNWSSVIHVTRQEINQKPNNVTSYRGPTQYNQQPASAVGLFAPAGRQCQLFHLKLRNATQACISKPHHSNT